MLKGNIAVVTGSAKGIGRAVAVELANNGATVVVCYRKNKSLAEETLKEVQRYSSSSFMVQGDVTKIDDVCRMFNEIFIKTGKVDVLVNNVGDFILKQLSEMSLEEWKDIIETNLYSVLFCCQQVLPKMREQNYGRIINMGCAGCDRFIVRRNTTPYYIAKTGVLMLSRALAAAEAPNGITVNIVSPGIAENSIIKNVPIPIGRCASFKDITNAVLFFLKEESSYITGANIEVSGGWASGY